MNLEEIRVEIDKVDLELKELFIKRMNLVNEVYLYKKENNLPVKNQKREDEIIKKRTDDLENYKVETTEFFKTLMDISCKYQEQNLNIEKKCDTEFEKVSEEEFLKSVSDIVYQGISGSYGNEMAKKIFKGKNIIAKNTFKDVCKSIKNKEAQAGVLPIENLSAGSINEVYDLIEEYGLNIVMAKELEIDHCLLGAGTFDDIEKVKSHPQALMQCDKFISENNFVKEESLNTAFAAKELSITRDKKTGVICNRINKDYYNLNLIKENISDIKGNKTRFIVVCDKKIIIDNPEKISIVFSLPHKAGSLSRALNEFSLNGFNLSKIESRSVKSDKWEYLFYADIEGSLLCENTKKYFEKISYLFDYIRIIGNY